MNVSVGLRDQIGKKAGKEKLEQSCDDDAVVRRCLNAKAERKNEGKRETGEIHMGDCRFTSPSPPGENNLQVPQ